jgi:hypothetical protein
MEVNFRGKKSYNIGPWCQPYKFFFLYHFKNKLECFSLKFLLRVRPKACSLDGYSTWVGSVLFCKRKASLNKLTLTNISLFCTTSNGDEKGFMTLTLGVNGKKVFFLHHWQYIKIRQKIIFFSRLIALNFIALIFSIELIVFFQFFVDVFNINNDILRPFKIKSI